MILPPPLDETRVLVGLQRFVHNASIALGVPPSRVRDLLISILRRAEAES